MTKFEIASDVEMRMFFEQQPEKLNCFLNCQSSQKYVKSKYRTSLSHERLKSILIIGTTKFEPNVEESLSDKHVRTSHWWSSYWIKYIYSAQTLMKILFLWGK
jgi:hypothetical protein